MHMKKGSVELGASALASMFVNVSAWSISYGTTTALDTLCSQAWTGAKDKTIIGVHLQRAYLVLSIMFVPIACIWWNAEPIMLSLNQDPELAKFAGKVKVKNCFVLLKKKKKNL